MTAAAEHVRGLTDIISAVSVYERDSTTVVAVCDGPAAAVTAIAAAADIPVEVIHNPRAGRRDGLFGGSCCGTLAGLAFAARQGPSLIIKLDCDALVIDPFIDRLQQLLVSHPRAGVAGAILHGDQTVELARAVRRLALPVAIWRNPRPGYDRILPLLSGPRRRVTAILRRARKRGWPPGTHCQGGAYAISAQLVKALDSAGILDRPLDWLDLPLGEDVMMAALAVAFGFELLDASGLGEPFGVYWRRLPAPAPELITRRHALIHSLKGDPDGRSESELRAFFATRRAANTTRDIPRGPD